MINVSIKYFSILFFLFDVVLCIFKRLYFVVYKMIFIIVDYNDFSIQFFYMLSSFLIIMLMIFKILDQVFNEMKFLWKIYLLFCIYVIL